MFTSLWQVSGTAGQLLYPTSLRPRTTRRRFRRRAALSRARRRIAEECRAVRNRYRRMTTGAVQGSVRLWLRLEGLVVLVLALYLYARGGHSWPVFAMLFFLPDISFAGYFGGPRVGAAVYNVAHSYVGPLLLAVALLTTGATILWALIWAAHVGFDRALCYGLKYPAAFAETHLGRIGRRNRPKPQNVYS